IVPLIILLRHSLPLYSFFFLFFLPGPCILVGIFLAKTADAINRVPTTRAINCQTDAINRVRMLARYGVYVLAGLIIVAQFLSSTVGILDIDHGNYSDGFKYGATY